MAIELSGPLLLTAENIDRYVTEISAGAYALDRNPAGAFQTHRVGRSDVDLNSRLKDYVGRYAYFKATYLASAKAAFEAECHLFHDFNPPDNAIHPDRPANSSWTCPRCYSFG